jgi:guanylate kinase
VLRLDPPDRGALFVLSGPSGVGKSTLIKHVMGRVPGVEFSVSATTRGPRAGEQDGVHYHFLTQAQFDEKVGQDAFLEHASVYDRSYGTLAEPVLSAIESGRSVLLDIDVQGARQVKARYPDCVRIFILAPSLAVLEQRLKARGTDDAEVLRRRMAQVGLQLQGAPEFDYVVLNDELEPACAVIEGIFLAELARVGRRRSMVQRVLAQLP